MKLHIPNGHNKPVLGYRYTDEQLKELKRNGGKFLNSSELLDVVCILAGDLIEMQRYCLDAEKRITELYSEKVEMTAENKKLFSALELKDTRDADENKVMRDQMFDHSNGMNY